MDLKPYRDTWPAEDPHANFKAEVACYTAADPLPTIENLSRNTGIPAGCLIRYVLVKYAASGSEAVMALLARDPIVFRQMRDQVERAEADGSAEAKLKAYEALKQIIAWLNVAQAIRTDPREARQSDPPDAAKPTEAVPGAADASSSRDR